MIESGRKILPPYGVDPDLCLYSPQDNVDALAHPRVVEWLEFVRQRYHPPRRTVGRRILLMLPCTRTKPYVASTEHLAINQRLLDEGFEPVDATLRLPDEIIAMHPEADPRLFDLAPLRRDDVEIARVVMSEPLAFVPYEHLVDFEGSQSPATSYDDPGLFEKRGNAVSPWRPDCTAERLSSRRWRWGPNERRAYVTMHNAMAAAVADVLIRLASAYDHTLSWVAPGLTHRSFCLAHHERADHGVPASKLVDGKFLDLVGVNDRVEPHLRIEVLPTTAQCDDARDRLGMRMGLERAAATGVFARGGGGATPLALPELLDVLVERIDQLGAVAPADSHRFGVPAP